MIRKLIFFFMTYSISTQAQNSLKKDNFSVLENKAYEVILYHCGDCHIASSPMANIKALKIFKLNTTSWYKDLTSVQKQKTVTMLKDRLSLTKEELGEQFLAKRVLARKPSDEEIKSYEDFVNALKEKSLLKTLFY